MRKPARTIEQKLEGVVQDIRSRGFRSTNDFIKTFYRSKENCEQSLRFTEGTAYAPAEILGEWLTNVPSGNSTDALNGAIVKEAGRILISESTKAIRDSKLSLPISTLTIGFLTGNFGLNSIKSSYVNTLPHLWALLLSLLIEENDYERYHNTEKEGKVDRAEKTIVVLISILLYFRNRATNAFALVLGIFLASSGASRRIIDTFHHMGLSSSYQSVQRSLMILSGDAKKRAKAFIETSDRLWGIVYDNINFTLRASSQRLDSTTRQINATTLAVFSFPAEFTRKSYRSALSLLERNKLRGEREKLTLESLRPDAEKHRQMLIAFEYAVGSILLQHAPGAIQRKSRNRKLRKFNNRRKPKVRVLGHEKTEFFPLPAMDEEESSIQGTIRVVKTIFTVLLDLTQEVVEAEIRLMVGDWLTIRNLRLMKTECKEEESVFLKFDWVQEVAMPFHFQLNALYCIFRTHLGTIAQQDPSSLEHHRNLLCRAKLDIKKPEYNKAKELLLHSLTARLIDCLRIVLEHENLNDTRKWKPTSAEFQDVVSAIVKRFATSSAASDALDIGDEVIAHSILFIRDALFFWEFCDAVRDADTSRMWLVYDFWVFMMRGAGCHNYGNEILEMKAQFQYEFPPLLRKVIERSWLVNRWGEPGRSIPTDLYLEHNNGFTKNMFAALGSCASIEYIQEKGSACVEILRLFAKQMAEWFGGNELNRQHREVSVAADIQALCEDIQIQRLHEPRQNRSINAQRSRKGSSKYVVLDMLDEGMKLLSNKNMFEQWKRRGNLDKYGMDGSEEEDEAHRNIEAAFTDPNGCLEVDTGLDDEFLGECPFSNVDHDISTSAGDF